MSKAKYYDNRWYDGEQEFLCSHCSAREVDYLLDFDDPASWRTPAGDFFSKQTPPRCPNGHGYMNWTGYSGGAAEIETIAGGLLSLLNQNHYLAACMLFSAATEYQLNSLLWAALVDFGYDRERAAEYADGTLSNGEVVRLLRVVLSQNLKTIVLPARNSMVHGREFGHPKDYFRTRLLEMAVAVTKWVDSFEHTYASGNPTELDRWFLYMRHWLAWCDRRLSQLERGTA